MLWRPAGSPVEPLSAGMRGQQVRSLRQSRDRLHGAPADAQARGVVEGELRTLVRELQRQHQLAVDGLLGLQTQIALASAVAGADVPLLSAVDAHHGE